MASTDPVLRVSQDVFEGEQQSTGLLRASLQAMTWAAQAKNAAIQDLHNRLQAALQAVSSEAERRRALEEEVEQAKAREAALIKRAQKAEAAEEALAVQLADTEAEAYMLITQSGRLGLGWIPKKEEEEEGVSQLGEISHRLNQVDELRQGLGMAEAALGDVQVKLRQSEEEKEALQLRLSKYEALQMRSEGDLEQQNVVVRKKQHSNHEDLVSLSLQDLTGLMKFRLWNPSSLAVTASR